MKKRKKKIVKLFVEKLNLDFSMVNIWLYVGVFDQQISLYFGKYVIQTGQWFLQSCPWLCPGLLNIDNCATLPFQFVS